MRKKLCIAFAAIALLWSGSAGESQAAGVAVIDTGNIVCIPVFIIEPYVNPNCLIPPYRHTAEYNALGTVANRVTVKQMLNGSLQITDPDILILTVGVADPYCTPGYGSATCSVVDHLVIKGNEANDQITLRNNTMETNIYGGEGNDTIKVTTSYATIDCGPGVDTVVVNRIPGPGNVLVRTDCENVTGL
jgi:hypothetical protein